MLMCSPFATVHAASVVGPSAASGLSLADKTATMLPRALWLSYRDHFVSMDGRVIDDANGGISHSEGQGYGMLLALAAGDDLSFARIWAWTARELYRRDDGLASWRWNPATDPHLTDMNNATDGDILIAWALADAGARWNSPEYKAASRRIALAIGRKTTIETRYGLTLLPGASGFRSGDMDDGPIVNPSYWIYPAFPSLKAVAPEIDWSAISASGIAILNAAQFGPLHLPTEWVSLKDETPAPAEKFKPEFGYNAIRIPLYLVWGGESVETFAPFAHAWADAPSGRPSVVDVATGRAVEPFYDPGYAALASLVVCASGGSASGINAGTVTFDRYYAVTMNLLSLVAMHQRGLRCG